MAVTTKLTYGGVVHDIHDKEIEDLRLSANEGKAIGFNASGEAIAIDTIEKATKDGNGNTIVSTYLPLSGGTMSGTITTSSTDGLVKTSTASLLNLCGGTNTNSGASLILSGKDKATYPGEFWLNATSDGVNIKSLIGKPDGSFTWNGNSVITAAGGTMTGVLKDKLGYDISGVPNTADAHNAIFRGRDLTSVYSVEQLASKVANSDFSDLFIGDFITKSVTVNGNTTTQNWRFAGFNWFHANYYVSTPHIVMVPDGCLVVNVNMNDTNTTVGGYFGSRMHTQTIPQVDSALETAFGSSHVLTHKRLLTTAINGSTPTGNGMGWSGASSSTDWKDVKSCLMSETMVYGHPVYSSSAMDNVDCMGRFPLFNHARRFSVNTGATFWLSCVASSTSFCSSYVDGSATYHNASYSRSWLGVRPYFLFS